MNIKHPYASVLLLLIAMPTALCPPASSAPAPTTTAGARSVFAPTAGAALDSDLMEGGGTDDIAVLQKILNRAEKGTPVHLIIDGPALVSGLDVYGNTTIECIAGGGLYLKGGANRSIIRNVHRSRDAIIDERITVRGCFLHGNKPGQDGGTQSYVLDGVAHQFFPRNQEADGSYFAGLQFFGVNYLTIENVTIWNVRAFASHVANANRIDVRNVIVDNGIKPGVLPYRPAHLNAAPAPPVFRYLKFRFRSVAMLEGCSTSFEYWLPPPNP